MMNDFNPSNLVLFKVNNYDYVLHKHVAHKMDLFNSLMDKKNIVIIDIINITWKISPENVNMVFHFINDFSYSKLDKNIGAESCNEIVSFMKYVGIESTFIRKILKNLLKCTTDIVQYVVDCLENKYYDDEFILETLNNHFYWTKNHIDLKNTNELSEISKILKKLNHCSLSIDRKVSIIRNAILCLSKNIISKCRACFCFGLYVGHREYIDDFYQSYGLVFDINLQMSQERDATGEFLIATLRKVKINGACTYVYDPRKDNKMDLVEFIIDDIAKLLLNIRPYDWIY